MNTISINEVGGVIAELRKARGDTQQQMAAHIGISTQAVSKWETGASLPDIALLPGIADYLNVSIDSLFGRNDTKTTGEPGELTGLFESTEEDRIPEAVRRCWKTHLGFGKDMSLSVEDAERIMNSSQTSSVISDGGFSNIRNGLGYAFLVDPENGWSSIFGTTDTLTAFFHLLAEPGLLSLLGWILRQETGFTREAASADHDIDAEKCEELFIELEKFRLLKSAKVRERTGSTITYKINTNLLPTFLAAIAFCREFLTCRESYMYYLRNRAHRYG